MDAHEAIVTKRDTRSYLPDPVEPELLDRVLRAARMAGSAKNSQLTRIVVVTEQAGRDGLAGCVAVPVMTGGACSGRRTCSGCGCTRWIRGDP